MNQMIRTSDIALDPRPLPSWARNFACQKSEGRTKTEPSSDLEAGFVAGAALAALDAILRTDPPWAGAFRLRLALAAAAATVRLLGRAEDERALRDAWLLRRAGDDLGPAGRTLHAWRLLAAHSDALSDQTIYAAAGAFELKHDSALGDIVGVVQGIKNDGRPAVMAAANIAAVAFERRPDAEPLALWLADAVLGKLMRWPIAVPLLACQIQHPSLKFDGRRVRPGEPAWSKTCFLAYARAAVQACDLASDLSRRSEKLLAVAPQLRAKGSAEVVATLLADDAVTTARSSSNMSDRALRRLFDRLVELGALRELSGRATFRIYGL